MFRFANLDSAQWILPDYMLRSWGKKGTDLAKGSFHWALRPSDSLLLKELNQLVQGSKTRNLRELLRESPFPSPATETA